jgi:hypothetical protein
MSYQVDYLPGQNRGSWWKCSPGQQVWRVFCGAATQYYKLYVCKEHWRKICYKQNCVLHGNNPMKIM